MPTGNPSSSEVEPPSPRAVLFDAGNTLLFVDPERVLAVLAEAGIEADTETFRRAEYEARLTLARAVGGESRGTESRVWESYFEPLLRGCGVPEGRVEEVGERLRDVYRSDHLWTRVEDGTRDALERLRRRGHRLAVLSNSDGRVESLLERVGLAGFFEFVLDSHRVGFEKPDPRIFELALERLGLEAGRVLYVGDLYPVDVVGARRAGLRAVLVDPGGRQEAPVDRIASLAELPAYLARREG